MFEQRLMLAGLRKQRSLLENLIGELETNPDSCDTDCVLYETMTRRVEINLKKLRKIKKNYFDYLN